MCIRDSLRGGLSLRDAVEAVRDGLAEGMAACASAGRPILARQILTSMRHAAPSSEIAELAVAYRHDSVCGFDIAGAEDGFPPTRFAAAFEYLRRHNFEYTIHAGEAFGLPSIWEAVQLCGASRLGHGVRLVEDVAADGTLGDLATYIRDRRIPDVYKRQAMQSMVQTPLTLTMVLQAVVVLFVAAPALVTTLIPFLKQRRPEVAAASLTGGQP